MYKSKVGIRVVQRVLNSVRQELQFYVPFTLSLKTSIQNKTFCNKYGHMYADFHTKTTLKVS